VGGRKKKWKTKMLMVKKGGKLRKEMRMETGNCDENRKLENKRL